MFGPARRPHPSSGAVRASVRLARARDGNPSRRGGAGLGRSTDLCREGIGVTVTGELTPEELVAMQIPLPSTKPMNVRARCATAPKLAADLLSSRLTVGQASMPASRRCDLRCALCDRFFREMALLLIHEHTRLSQSGLTMNQSQTAVLLGFWAIRCAR